LTDTNQAYHNFITSFTNLYDKAFPKITVKTKTHAKKNWMTPALLKSCHIKEKLYKKYLNSPTIENKLKYNTYKNKFTHIRRLTEKNYFCNKLLLSKNNLKDTWKVIREALNKNTPFSSIPKTFKYSNVILTSDNDISEKFNEFFTNIGPNLDAKIGASPLCFNSFLKNEIKDSLYIAPSTNDDIISIVKQFKNKTSFGWDGIPMTVIKETINLVVDPLNHIFNLSINQGCFPSEMKIAKVIPIYKCEARDEFANYRPISLLPTFSKILEKLIFNKLNDFLIKYHVLYDQQYGFRKNYSTELALIDLSDKIAKAIDDKRLTIGIFIDLSKAFDSLKHDILLKKLSHYGVRGIAQDWFRSYLTNREQFVVVNGVRSSKSKIITGVPQGSILGPLLFLLYINDLCNASALLKFILYADDTNIFYSGNDINEMCNIVNSELKLVIEWFKVNRLSVNSKKTNFMIFGTHAKLNKLKSDCTIVLDGIAINRSRSAKFLGVVVDDQLNWKEHIHYISGKIAKNIGIIKRFQHRFDPQTLISLYNTLILPYLNYCNLIWANNKPSRLKHLEVLQKRVIRIINGSHYCEHALPLFGKVHQLTLADLNKLSIASFMYQYHAHQMPPQFEGFFCLNSDVHTHLTRQHSKLHMNYARTDIMRQQLRVTGPPMWNSIDPHLISTSLHLQSFKRKLKKQFISSYV
ncbi:MAG: reverse transcriptase family protein, partial [Oscillospiraceae bacterium]